MGISWVAGTTPTYSASSAGLASTTPAGIQDDDGLFCFIRTSNDVTMTSPAGWTELGQATATAGAGYSKVWVFRKDTVVVANSSTSYTWTPSSASQIAVTYAVVRAVGSVVVKSLAFRVESNVNDGIGAAYLPQTVSARNGNMFLMAGASYWGFGGSQANAIQIAGSDATMWTGSYNLNLFSAAYSTRNQGQTPKTSSTEWYFAISSGTNNGKVGVTLEVQDTAVEVTATDTVSLDYHTNEGDYFPHTQSDSFSVSDTSAQLKRRTFEAFEYVDFYIYETRAAPALYAQDTIGSSDTLARAFRPAREVVVRPRIIDTPLTEATYNLTVPEGVALSTLLRVGIPRSAADTIGAADTAVAVRASTVIERLRLTDTLLGKGTFGLAYADAALLADALRRFFGMDVADTIAGSETLSRVRISSRTGADTIGAADTLAPKLVLRLVLPDTITLTDTEALQLIFRPAVSDEVEISAAYVSPGDSFTTWAINTRTGATTEYTNYAFNSFARLGRRYIGATSDGLYVLDGDTDAGADIIADIQSGLFQMAGSRFTAFKAAYLGIRGEGEFFLKLIEGDGVSRTYRAVAQTMETTKVWLGKGLRSRYYSFELVSTGQDFDLDSVEFIPLSSKRRV